MKIKLVIVIATLAVVLSNSVFSQVGIGTTTPHASAELDVTSTAKGFLPPRMTQLERNAIASAAAGLIVWCTDCGSSGEVQVYNGVVWTNLIGGSVSAKFIYCNGVPTTIVNVTNPSTGKIWMDRNLGATQAATSSTDASSYGDLYQWGRTTDGHQCRNSTTTNVLSSSDKPEHGNFIITASSDWLSPQNANLWQGVNGGVNNPCPNGYRLPTSAELTAERLSWGANDNKVGAFTSPLKLPMAGYRAGASGSLTIVGTYGVYWSSSISSGSSYSLDFNSTSANILTDSRVNGFSVRCIKN
jgi:uncharacterized protein (TIGR02145 family)